MKKSSIDWFFDIVLLFSEETRYSTHISRIFPFFHNFEQCHFIFHRFTITMTSEQSFTNNVGFVTKNALFHKIYDWPIHYQKHINCMWSYFNLQQDLKVCFSDKCTPKTFPSMMEARANFMQYSRLRRDLFCRIVKNTKY